VGRKQRESEHGSAWSLHRELGALARGAPSDFPEQCAVLASQLAGTARARHGLEQPSATGSLPSLARCFSTSPSAVVLLQGRGCEQPNGVLCLPSWWGGRGKPRQESPGTLQLHPPRGI